MQTAKERDPVITKDALIKEQKLQEKQRESQYDKDLFRVAEGEVRHKRKEIQTEYSKKANTKTKEER